MGHAPNYLVGCVIQKRYLFYSFLIVGARNVKWLKRIVLSPEESHSHWQRGDYKGFNPSIDWKTVDFTKSPSGEIFWLIFSWNWINEYFVKLISQIFRDIDLLILYVFLVQNMPVTSLICQSKLQNGKLELKGYAWAGGGNRIIRIDLTTDHGETWSEGVIDSQSNDR